MSFDEARSGTRITRYEPEVHFIFSRSKLKSHHHRSVGRLDGIAVSIAAVFDRRGEHLGGDRGDAGALVEDEVDPFLGFVGAAVERRPGDHGMGDRVRVHLTQGESYAGVGDRLGHGPDHDLAVIGGSIRRGPVEVRRIVEVAGEEDWRGV